LVTPSEELATFDSLTAKDDYFLITKYWLSWWSTEEVRRNNVYLSLPI
jgi:hypothetical protein